MDNPNKVIVNAYSDLLWLTRRRFPTFNGSEANLIPILMRYREPWRCFHINEHIADGFQKLRAVYDIFKDPLIIWWAWFYHDAVFVPTAPQANEYCSAQLAKQELMMMGMPAAFAEQVGACVYATWDHLVPHDYRGNANDLALMLDVDLSGLGAPRAVFEATGMQIRQEYRRMSNHISDVDFRRRQVSFCKSLLNREKIFHTKTFAHLETTAQENLAWAVGQAEGVEWNKL